MATKAPYTVRIRESLLKNNGSGYGIHIRSYSFGANQKIQISDCTLAGYRDGIAIVTNYIYLYRGNQL